MGEKCSKVFVMSSDDDIRQQLAELSGRLASLEAEVRSLRAAQPSAYAAEAAAPKPSLKAQETKPGDAPSLESRIGAQLLNRIGILAVLVGVAWFLKLAFDRNWIGPPVRVWIGLAAAAGLVGWSERFRRQGFPAFSFSLKALGTSIAYLSLWAASSVFHLGPSWLIFLAMTAVTIANALLARRQNSEVLGLYALAGGLATPGLLSVGHNNEIFLFLYLALLNAGALFLVASHQWKRVAWAALLGTAGYHIGWSVIENDPSHLPLMVFFLAIFFALFAVAPFLILHGARELPPNSFLIAFSIANAAATWVALMLLFGVRGQHGGRPWVTIALAGGCFLMAVARRRPAVLSATNIGLAIVFVTVAVPLEFDGTTITLCWLGESLALVALARARADAVLRFFATSVLTVTALSLLVDWIAGTPQPLAVVTNMHFATNLVGAAVFAIVTRLSLGGAPGRGFGSWTYLSVFSTVAFSLTVLVAVSLEIHHYWFCGAGFFRDFCGAYGPLERRSIAAGWGYSAWCMIYGAILMAAGFFRRSAFLRWQALVVLAFSIAKVFLNGVSQQSQGYRVLSFLALGVLLLAISFAYQRNWLGLRG
jgi:uncharacterized membrane protein